MPETSAQQQRSGVHGQGLGSVGNQRLGATGVHPARQADGEQPCGELQRQVPRGMPERHAFRSLAEAREIIKAWRQNYNTAQPHSSLGGLAPEEYGRAMNEEYQNGQSPNLRLAYSAG